LPNQYSPKRHQAIKKFMLKEAHWSRRKASETKKEKKEKITTKIQFLTQPLFYKAQTLKLLNQ
jgi:hypothetical protein